MAHLVDLFEKVFPDISWEDRSFLLHHCTMKGDQETIAAIIAEEIRLLVEEDAIVREAIDPFFCMLLPYPELFHRVYHEIETDGIMVDGVPLLSHLQMSFPRMPLYGHYLFALSFLDLCRAAAYKRPDDEARRDDVIRLLFHYSPLLPEERRASGFTMAMHLTPFNERIVWKWIIGV